MNTTGSLGKIGFRTQTEQTVNIANMRTVIRTAAAVLIGVGVAVAPAYAQHAGGGGGHVGGGGGHFGGGGHVSAPSFGGGHVGMPHFGGGHVFGAPHFQGSAYGGLHVARPGYAGGHLGAGYVAGHVGPGYAGSAYYRGGHYWRGGYWHGGYWPYVYYRPGWCWFYPVLPIGYATFWWGGLPYYYWNNLYYTWSPGYNGYVVTDPPPLAGGYDDSGSADSGAVTAEPSDAAPAPGAGTAGGSDLFVYPRNGQSEQQSSTDRYECHSWAVNQTGFDPTRSQQTGTGSVADYRRAMIACLDARGYSAR